MQGRTLPKLILSLPTRRFSPHLNLTSFYVFVSRVTSLDGLRVLYRDEAALSGITALKHDAYLMAWDLGYDTQGAWSDAAAIAALAKVRKQRSEADARSLAEKREQREATRLSRVAAATTKRDAARLTRKEATTTTVNADGKGGQRTSRAPGATVLPSGLPRAPAAAGPAGKRPAQPTFSTPPEKCPRPASAAGAASHLAGKRMPAANGKQPPAAAAPPRALPPAASLAPSPAWQIDADAFAGFGAADGGEDAARLLVLAAAGGSGTPATLGEPRLAPAASRFSVVVGPRLSLDGVDR